MTLLHAFLLGLIRGMTEFIPVSSIAYFTSLEWIDKMEN
jgi:undecaprenyl pyrophosphate phosphatase UppP